MKTFVVAVWVFIIAGIGGWIANIVKLMNTGLEVVQWGGMEIARVIGVFVPPLGAVLGFF